LNGSESGGQRDRDNNFADRRRQLAGQVVVIAAPTAMALTGHVRLAGR